MNTKNYIVGAIIALALSIVVTFVYGTWIVDELTIPEAIKGEQGIQGIQGEKGDTGLRGYTGAKGADGKDGTNGTNGTNGVDGKDAVVDIYRLATLVEDIIDGDQPVWTKTGGEGNFTYTFTVDDDGHYSFNLWHFAAGDFVVTFEDEDGGTVTLVDTEGHVNTTFSSLDLDEDEVYTLHTSADGYHKIEIEKYN